MGVKLKEKMLGAIRKYILTGSQKKKGIDSFSHKAVSQFMLKLTSPPPSKSVTSQIKIMLDVHFFVHISIRYLVVSVSDPDYLIPDPCAAF